MFRVSFLVDDRRLGDALKALAGLARGAPEVLPATNIKMKNGKATAATDGSNGAQFLEYVSKRKFTQVNAQIAKDFLREIGGSPLSATYLLRHGITAGVLRKVGKGSAMTYKVIEK